MANQDQQIMSNGWLPSTAGSSTTINTPVTATLEDPSVDAILTEE